MQYKTFPDRPLIQLDHGDGNLVWIPTDPGNRDYQAYLAWVATGGVPVVDAPSLADLKAAKLNELQQRKGVALGSMQYAMGGQTYTITLTTQDQVDVMMQIQLLQAQPAGTTVLWEIVNNAFLNLALADLQAIQGAGVVHVQAAYTNTASLADQINAAADQAALDAIDLNAGWPE